MFIQKVSREKLTLDFSINSFAFVRNLAYEPQMRATAYQMFLDHRTTLSDENMLDSCGTMKIRLHKYMTVVPA